MHRPQGVAVNLRATAIATAQRELSKRGFNVLWAPRSDMPSRFWELHERCHTHSMTGPERLYAMHEAVRYVHARDIPGAIVECGVWRGGSAMMAALTLLQLRDTSRKLWLYDTFRGMPRPGARDVDINGSAAQDRWVENWCAASVGEVKRNLVSTGYPVQQVVYVDGMVEETIPESSPEEIALLRLDTDFYESTKHELEHLYSKLTSGGVLIIDDYGNWQGARRAVDEYFAAEPLLFSRLDYSGRMAVKA